MADVKIKNIEEYAYVSLDSINEVYCNEFDYEKNDNASMETRYSESDINHENHILKNDDSYCETKTRFLSMHNIIKRKFSIYGKLLKENKIFLIINVLGLFMFLIILYCLTKYR